MTAQTRKTKVPDGRGGWTEIEGEVLPGGSMSADKQEAARKQQFILEAAGITARLLQFDRVLIVEGGLTKQHRAFAAALYCVNLRETYPNDANTTPDPEAFDAIAKMAAEYYDANVPKKR